MKTQFRDPDGLLNCLSNITADSPVFEALLGASEEFDPCMIRRNTHLTHRQRAMLLDRSSKPLTLKAISRAYFRKVLGRSLPEVVPNFFIPKMLHKFLLYEHN